MDQSSYRFLTAIQKSTKPLLSDGAMGTMLNAQGVGFEACFDALNLNNPELVVNVHRLYLSAGADVIQTNTFGANRYKLAAHNLENQVAAINQQGVELVRQAAASLGKRCWWQVT
jgi:homocysteine S-methyltransferase